MRWADTSDMPTAPATDVRRSQVHAQRVQVQPAELQIAESTRSVQSTSGSVRHAASASTQSASRRMAQGREVMARHAASQQPTLRMGSHGPGVERLQRQLNHHGAHLTVDGAFGAKTQAAVKTFQAHHHLVKDGIVGPITHGALDKSHGTHDAAPIHHAAAHGTSTVAGCAKILLDSPNVTFWTGLSSGSERANFQRLARGQDARVSATNRTTPSHVKPSLRIMQALVEMSRKGSIQINAVTGGTHSFNSNHYQGRAIDLSVVGATEHDHLGAHHKRFLTPSEITSIANRHGGARNSESDHIHLDF